MSTTQITVGQRYTSRANAANVKYREIEKQIVMLQPERNSNYSLISALGQKPTPSLLFEHAEDDQKAITVVAQNTLNTSDTSLDLTGFSKRVRRDAIGITALGERIRFTDVDYNTEQATISRNFPAGGTGSAITSGETIYIVTEAFEEGVAFVSAQSHELDLYSNYVQEFEMPVEMSNLQMGTLDYTTPDWNHQVKKAAIDFKELQARTFWAGAKGRATGANGKYVHYTGGIDEFLTDGGQYETLSGILTRKVIADAIADVIPYGHPNRLMMFGGTHTWVQLSAIADGYVTTERSEKVLGITIQKVVVNGKTIPFVEDRTLDRIGWNNRLYLLNMGCFRKRYLQANGHNFSTKWYREIQANDLKGRKDTIYGICGLQRENVKAHKVLKGFSL